MLNLDTEDLRAFDHQLYRNMVMYPREVRAPTHARHGARPVGCLAFVAARGARGESMRCAVAHAHALWGASALLQPGAPRGESTRCAVAHAQPRVGYGCVLSRPFQKWGGGAVCAGTRGLRAFNHQLCHNMVVHSCLVWEIRGMYRNAWGKLWWLGLATCTPVATPPLVPSSLGPSPSLPGSAAARPGGAWRGPERPAASPPLAGDAAV